MVIFPYMEMLPYMVTYDKEFDVLPYMEIVPYMEVLPYMVTYPYMVIH